MRGHSAVLDDRPLLDQPYELRRRKLAELPYLPGKRPDFWAKHPLVQTREVIVCGWRQGQSGFTGTVGGLLLGAHDPDTGELVYIGDIGTGFTRQDRDQLRDRLVPLERRTHPFVVAPPREDIVRARWVSPKLVGKCGSGSSPEARVGGCGTRRGVGCGRIASRLR